MGRIPDDFRQDRASTCAQSVVLVWLLLLLRHWAVFSQSNGTPAVLSPSQANQPPRIQSMENETVGEPMLAGKMATNLPHRMLPSTEELHPQPTSEGVLSRWFELQSAVIASRYRFVANSDGATTANGVQYRPAFKGRIKFDSRGKYTISAGVFSGNGFTRGWSGTSWGTGNVQSNVYLKQLYFAARPVDGFEIEYGGLYVLHGESTEITSYDYHGYLVGQRISLQRPQHLFFDEVSVTYAYLGDLDQANLNRRFHRLKKSNYHQYLLSKRLGKRLVVSGDYTSDAGVDTLRQAFKLRIPELRIIDSFHFENYQRTGLNPAYGIGTYGEKSLAKRLTLGGGYASIDRNYGRLNSDHFSVGKRLYLTANLAISPEFSAAVFLTRAFATDYPIPVRTRFDVVFSYNLLSSLKRTKLL